MKPFIQRLFKGVIRSHYISTQANTFERFWVKVVNIVLLYSTHKNILSCHWSVSCACYRKSNITGKKAEQVVLVCLYGVGSIIFCPDGSAYFYANIVAFKHRT